jgi:four helix bundle protein
MVTATKQTTGFVKDVENLEVYRLAFIISLEIHKASLLFPKIEQFALADQVRRSSKSICANLAEGFARQPHSPADFRRFVTIAASSCGETITWLHYCKSLRYIEENTYLQWKENYISIAKMLQKLRGGIKIPVTSNQSRVTK